MFLPLMSRINYNFVTKYDLNKIMAKILVQNTEVTILLIDDSDYISLTDIAKYNSNEPAAVIGNWMRNRNTIEYLGIWESLNNSNFNPLEFEGVKKDANISVGNFFSMEYRIHSTGDMIAIYNFL